MDPVLKAVVKGPAAKPAKLTKVILFTTSEIKYGLWKYLVSMKNGQEAPTAGETLVNLFVLNGDSDKAVSTAKDVVAAKDKILDATAFVFEAAKPVTEKTGVHQEVAWHIQLSVTGAEVKARAAAILQLKATERTPITLEKSDKTTVKASKGNLAAGLI